MTKGILSTRDGALARRSAALGDQHGVLPAGAAATLLQCSRQPSDARLDNEQRRRARARRPRRDTGAMLPRPPTTRCSPRPDDGSAGVPRDGGSSRRVGGVRLPPRSGDGG